MPAFWQRYKRRWLPALLGGLLGAYPLCYSFETFSIAPEGSLPIKLLNFVTLYLWRSVSPWVLLLCSGALAACCLYAFAPEAARRLRRGQRAALVALCAAFALLGTLAISVANTGDLRLFTENAITLARTLTQTAGLAVLYLCALRAALRAAGDYAPQALAPATATPNKRPWLLDRRPLLAAFGLILLCYLPYYYFSFPGGIGWDTVVQLEQALGLQPYSMRTALPNTVFYGLCYRLGMALGGSQRYALALITAVQTLLMAFAGAYAVSTLHKLGVPRGFRLAVLLFLALAPMLPSNAVFANKDAPFLAVFLVFVCQLMRFAADPEAVARDWRRLLLLALSCLAVLFTRVNGVLCVAPCVLVCAVALLRRKQPLGLTRRAFARVAGWGLLAPLALSLCLNGAVYPALGVEKNPVGDNVLAPLYVQTALFYQTCPEAVTPEEREVLLQIWDEEDLQTCRIDLVDQIRERVHYDRSATRADYLRVWAAQAARRPDLALQAYITLEGTYYNPQGYTHTMFGLDTQREFIHEEEIIAGQRDPNRSLFNRVRIWLSEQVVPLSFTSVAAYPLLGTLALALLLLCGRRKRALLVLCPSLGIVLSVVMAPVFSLRYAVAMMAALPVIVGHFLREKPSH